MLSMLFVICTILLILIFPVRSEEWIMDEGTRHNTNRRDSIDVKVLTIQFIGGNLIFYEEFSDSFDDIGVR